MTSSPGSTDSLRSERAARKGSRGDRERSPQTVTSKVSTGVSKSLYQARPRTAAFSRESAWHHPFARTCPRSTRPRASQPGQCLRRTPDIDLYSLSKFLLLQARALPTETKVESGTSQIKSGTSVNLCNSGEFDTTCERARYEIQPGR